MRRVITFIVRLWVDPQAAPPAWEGQMECVSDGAREHIRAPDELLAFIDAHTAPAYTRPAPTDPQLTPKV